MSKIKCPTCGSLVRPIIDKQKAFEMRKAGKSFQQIATRLGVSRERARQWIAKLETMPAYPTAKAARGGKS